MYRVGDLRFRLPVPAAPYSGTHNASAFGLACTQQNDTLHVPPAIASNITEFLSGGVIPTSGEDCKFFPLRHWEEGGG